MAERERAGGRLLLGAALPAATAIVVVAVAVLLLFLPPYIHAALDAAGAPQVLGVSAEEAHRLSDRTVAELFLGPATFDFAGPDGRRFYGPDEAAHLRDVRLVLFSFLGVAAAGAALQALALARGWRQPATWTAVARGGGALALVLAGAGLAAFLAFDLVFDIFHRLLFPGGNFAFDPATQRLVQLYPLPFWQLTAAALGVLGIGGGTVIWFLARRRARMLAAEARR